VEVANASVLIVRGKDRRDTRLPQCLHPSRDRVGRSGERPAVDFQLPLSSLDLATDGALVSAPDFDRFHVAKADCGLPRIAVDVCAGAYLYQLFENQCRCATGWEISPNGSSAAVARATTFTEYVYEIGRELEVTYDNFQENYHLRFIHARSSGAAREPTTPSAIRCAFAFTDRIARKQSGPIRRAEAALHTGARFCLATVCAREDGVSVSNDAKDLFRALPQFLHPGFAVAALFALVMPISATRSRGVIRLYWIGEDETASERFAREYLMAAAHSRAFANGSHQDRQSGSTNGCRGCRRLPPCERCAVAQMRRAAAVSPDSAQRRAPGVQRSAEALSACAPPGAHLRQRAHLRLSSYRVAAKHFLL